MPKVVRSIEINGNKLKCVQCGKEKNIKISYYKSKDPRFGISQERCYWCKECLEKKCFDDNGIPNRDNFREVLRDYLNLPFDQKIYEDSLQKNKRILGFYITQLNTRSGYKNKDLTWEDGETGEKNNGKNEEKLINNTEIDTNRLAELADKWGIGYSNEEYIAFEKKYQMLKNNYKEKTAMHTEALLTYVRYRCKEELATAKGNVKEAKDWSDMANKAATNAKINPSQLSKADLTEGLNTFGELIRAVEESMDIIPLLPKFKEKPQDKVDFTLWCYINYIRDLKGLPKCEYKEIYKFYDERKKEYEKHIAKEENGGIDG